MLKRIVLLLTIIEKEEVNSFKLFIMKYRSILRQNKTVGWVSLIWRQGKCSPSNQQVVPSKCEKLKTSLEIFLKIYDIFLVTNETSFIWENIYNCNIIEIF